MAMLFVWMEAWVHWAKYLGFEWYNRLKWLVVQVLSIVALLIVLVWLAVFMYGSFYYTYMPAVTHTREVHLQFGSECEYKGVLCTFPTANISLTLDGQNELLMRGQPYVIVLDMELPESPINRNHGMFMVKLDLFSRHGEVVRSSRRSSLLNYKSPLYRMIETLFYFPMYLSGTRTQKQKLSVTLFESYEEDPYKPALGAFVKIQSKRMEIYSSVLRIHAKFAGLRYLLYHWPIVSALCGIGTNMFFLVIVTLLSWYRFGEVPSEHHSGLAGSSRLSLQERRNKIREILDRERRGSGRSTPLSSSSGMLHSSSQPNLAGHRRSSSMTYPSSLPPETISHSVSASNLQDIAPETSLRKDRSFRISQDSIATTDYDDDDDRDVETYSTPSSGTGSHKSGLDEPQSAIRQRKT